MKKAEEVVGMEYSVQLSAIRQYYKERYEKALSLGIDENSRHYQAFREIKYRYEMTGFAMEVIDGIEKYILIGDDLERNVLGVLKMLMENLAIYEWIIDEDGNKECISKKIKIPRSDTEAISAFNGAKAAIEHLKDLGYEDTDRRLLADEVAKDIYEIVFWLLIARDLIYALGRWKNTEME